MALRSAAGAKLSTTVRADQPGLVTLVLHGGPEEGTSRCWWFLPQVLRCRLLAFSVARRWRRSPELLPELTVFRLQHAWTGWDGDGRAVLADVEWALSRIAARHPGVPIAMLGHSMGGRSAVRLAGETGVIGVVGLAPWLPADEPVDPLAGRRLTVVQGSRDRELPIATTAAFVARAIAAGVPLRQLVVRGGGHAMALRIGTWNRLATDELAALTGPV